MTDTKQRERRISGNYRGGVETYNGYDNDGNYVQIDKEEDGSYSVVISEFLDRSTNIGAIIDSQGDVSLLTSAVGNPRSNLDSLTKARVLGIFRKVKAQGVAA